MNELSRHIERLLLTHDCVVVPQFGGFVTMGVSATREEAEHLFFPPIRVVRFNPDLTEDDGILVADVRQERRCTESEAKRHIQHLVLQLRQQLLADGQADFGSTGLFTQDEDGRVSFAPCQAGVITPLYYGLDAFIMPRLSALQGRSKHVALKKRGQQQDEADADSRHITIRISRAGLRNAVMCAAIIVLCALFSSPIDEGGSRSNMASIQPTAPIEVVETATVEEPKAVQEEVKAVQEEATEQTEETAAQQKEGTEQPEAEAVNTETPEAASTEEAAPTAATTEQAEPTGSFCIVLASNVSLKNAERYAETLQRRGYGRARVYNNGRMIRVIIDGFATENEAYNLNAELHHTSKEYASTWVMKL